jgi:hypothetical protein
MISYKEILCGHSLADVEIRIQHNLEELLGRMNLIRTAYGKPMIVTSGFRSKQDHLRIYSEINAKRVKAGLPELNAPMGSRHLSGQAVDILDRDGSLHQWCKDNEDLLVRIGLWCEEKDSTPRVHFQTVPPASGKRFFHP